MSAVTSGCSMQRKEQAQEKQSHYHFVMGRPAGAYPICQRALFLDGIKSLSVYSVHGADGEEGVRVQLFDIAEHQVQVCLTGYNHQHLGFLFGVPALSVQDGYSAVHLLGDGVRNLFVLLGEDKQLHTLLGTGNIHIQHIAVYRYQNKAIEHRGYLFCQRHLEHHGISGCIQHGLSGGIQFIHIRRDEKGRADKSFVGSIVNFSFPIALQESSYALITWGSSFLIIKLSSYGELGILNAATQWMSVIAFVPGALRNVALSYFTSANDSIDQSHLLLKKLMLMTFVSVFVPCVLVWLFSSFICSFYGPEYSGMQRVLNVLVFTAVIASMTNMLSQELTAFGRNWYLFFTRLLRDVGILVLTALIVYHNPNGAFIYACSSLLFQLVYLILLYLKYKSIIKRMSV